MTYRPPPFNRAKPEYPIPVSSALLEALAAELAAAGITAAPADLMRHVVRRNPVSRPSRMWGAHGPRP